MRTLSVALAGAVALASASAAQATVTVVTPPTDVQITDYYSSDTGGYINYQKPVGQNGSFSDVLEFHNDTAGAFNVSALVSTLGGVTFDMLTFSGPFMGSPVDLLASPTYQDGSTTYSWAGNLGVGDYFLNLSGTAPAGTTFNGTVSFAALSGGVPEPATWGLMLLGFGLMGSSMRRRRARTAVAQLA